MYRGTTRDIKDVKRLLERGEITFQDLDCAYDSALNKAGKGSYGWLDPHYFAERYAVERQILSVSVDQRSIEE